MISFPGQYSLSVRAQAVLRHPLQFTWRVVTAFRRNGGMLLSAAVAYHTLLSIIPILALTAIGLSKWIDPASMQDAVKQFLGLVAPTQIDALLTQLDAFIANARVIGLIGSVSLIFFSAMAFSALQTALSVIFLDEASGNQRRPWLSFLIPYAFVLSIGLSILGVTLMIGAFEMLHSFGLGDWLPDVSFVTAFFGFVGEIILFAAIYYVLPPVKIRLKHALVGAIAAALLWEVMRRLLVWYFVNLSSVNVIYGTFATVLVIVLSLEVAITILLTGAQVIREYSLLESD